MLFDGFRDKKYLRILVPILILKGNGCLVTEGVFNPVAGFTLNDGQPVRIGGSGGSILHFFHKKIEIY